MEDKHGFGEGLFEFFAGKGFYIVLLLCAGLVATSIWLTANGSRAMEEAAERKEGPIPADAVPAMNDVTEIVVVTPAPTPVPRPETTPTPEPTAEAVETENAAVPVMEEIHYGLTDYFLWPVNGAVDRGYSLETLSYDSTMGDWRLHAGLDIGAPEGTPVLSVTDGIVAEVYTDERLGTVVEIDHRDGIRSVYANLQPVVKVHPGDGVLVGQTIGAVGSTAKIESGEAPHLHFSMTCEGRSVDPELYLPER